MSFPVFWLQIDDRGPAIPGVSFQLPSSVSVDPASPQRGEIVSVRYRTLPDGGWVDGDAQSGLFEANLTTQRHDFVEEAQISLRNGDVVNIRQWITLSGVQGSELQSARNFGRISFRAEPLHQDQILGPAYQFTGTIENIHASFGYKDMTSTMTFRRVWVGPFVDLPVERLETWSMAEWGRSGTRTLPPFFHSEGWPHGRYWLLLYVDGVIQQVGSYDLAAG